MGELVRIQKLLHVQEDPRVGLIENNTERLFLAEVEIEKPPYTCPSCGETHEYRITQGIPGMRWRTFALCRDLPAHDDLGTERRAPDSKGDWAREQLLRIFYWRDVYQRPAVVTTNYTVDELMDKVGGAAISRLLGLCTWHEIRAGDFRVRNKITESSKKTA